MIECRNWVGARTRAVVVFVPLSRVISVFVTAFGRRFTLFSQWASAARGRGTCHHAWTRERGLPSREERERQTAITSGSISISINAAS